MHVNCTIARIGLVLAAIVTVGASARASDPKAECIAAADQAQQDRDDGKYRAAREGFVACSRAACPKMVSASCTKWTREIEDGMPTLVLAAKDASGADLADVRVTFDGMLLVSSLDGKPVDVDPGAHKLRFEREGSESVEQAIVVKAGEKLRAVSVTLRSVERARPTPSTVTETPVARDEAHPGESGRVVTTIVLGILAGGALAGGIGFGLASQGDADSANVLRAPLPQNACVGAASTSSSCQTLASAVDSQNRDAALAVTMYVATGVLAAVALIAWFAWPKPKTERASTTFIIGPGFTGFGGRF